MLLDFVSVERESWAVTAVSPNELILVTHPGLDGLACPSHPPKYRCVPGKWPPPWAPQGLGDAEARTGWCSLPRHCRTDRACAVTGILQGLQHLNQFPISSFHQYQQKTTADKTCGQNYDKQVMLTAGKSRIIMRVTWCFLHSQLQSCTSASKEAARLEWA